MIFNILVEMIETNGTEISAEHTHQLGRLEWSDYHNLLMTINAIEGMTKEELSANDWAELRRIINE